MSICPSRLAQKLSVLESLPIIQSLVKIQTLRQKYPYRQLIYFFKSTYNNGLCGTPPVTPEEVRQETGVYPLKLSDVPRMEGDILIICTLVIAVSLAEPPVNNRYLPPQRGFSGGLSSPSQSYGAPFGGQRQTDAVFGSRPSSSYGTPSFNSRSTRPSSQYGLPSHSRSNLQAPSSQYLPARISQTPSTQYGTPRSTNYQASQFASRNQAPSTQYGAPSFQAPSTQYGAPNDFQAPSSQFEQPSTQYGAPGLGRSTPSQQYGAPALGGNQYSLNGGSSFGGTERSYLPPSARRTGYAGDDEANSEPANYNFEYMVKDEQSGNDFGHRESRQGDRAEGLYYVVLPDGRKQTVEYEADENGYKPRISYEDTGLGSAGYNRNSQSGYPDYQNQGGPY
ncbi:unnamed protein product [Diatraea saccharalis]|uniref:Pro-resilin n=1 Tax=Diatraea saccharalis TaxID=40085 RepID=A0A9N9R5W9_9NEOP|nr:unnamed protein product [Diatraea saccharalis]